MDRKRNKTRDAETNTPKDLFVVEKPPIPIVWLDAWVISNIAKASTGEIKGDDAALYLGLLHVLEQLRDRVAAICPETGQAAELQAKGSSAAEAPGILTRISGGVKGCDAGLQRRDFSLYGEVSSSGRARTARCDCFS